MKPRTLTMSIILTLLAATSAVAAAADAGFDNVGQRPPAANVAGQNFYAGSLVAEAWGADIRGGEQPWTVRSRLVELDLNVLHKAILTAPDRSTLTIDLFDNVSVNVEITDVKNRGVNRATFSGAVSRVIGGDVIISLRNESVYGTVSLPRIGVFEIAYAGHGLHRITQFDTNLMPECGAGQGNLIVPPPQNELRLDNRIGGLPLANHTVVVDVLVVYTPAARDAAGGTSAILAQIDAAMAQTNQALIASDTKMLMYLADAREVNYVEGGSAGSDPCSNQFPNNSDMRRDLCRLQNPSDGYMDEVHVWRDEVNADLVALLVHHPNFNFCGVGYMPSEPVANNPGFWSHWAFSATWTACLPGFTFSHELGHNLGCHHDHANSGGSSGSFPYSHGHRFFGNSNTEWRTIMAYAPGTRILHYSSPTVLYDGQPTGVQYGLPEPADNALTIDNNRVAISEYSTGGRIHVPYEQPTIQQAIDAASSGDEIIVWPGLYEEQINFNGKALHLKSADGPGTTAIGYTLLGPGPIVTCVSGEGPDTVLDGFTISGGLAFSGSGMVNSNSSPTVINCFFVSNHTEMNGVGGAMANSNNSHPLIQNCTFQINSATVGGAISNSSNSNPHIIDCTFLANSAAVGGAIRNQLSNPIITGCTFRNNSGGNVGGISNQEGSPTIMDCTFENNSGNTAGAMLNQGGGFFPEVGTTLFCGNSPNAVVGPYDDLGGNVFWDSCDPVVVHVPTDYNSIQLAINSVAPGSEIIVGPNTYYETVNLLDKNLVVRSSHGPTDTIIDAQFNNTAVTIAGGQGPTTLFEGFTVTGGGGVGAFGGGLLVQNSNPVVFNCWFVGNMALAGAGALNQNSDTLYIECKFEANGDLQFTDFGGGMANSDSSPMIISCTFSCNEAQWSGGGLHNDANSNPLVWDSLFCLNLFSHVGGPWSDMGGNLLLDSCRAVPRLAPWPAPGSCP